MNFFDLTAPGLELTCPADVTLGADADCLVDLDPALLGLPAVDATGQLRHGRCLFVVPCGYRDGRLLRRRAHHRTDVHGDRLTDDCGLQTTASCEQAITVVLDVTPPPYS